MKFCPPLRSHAPTESLPWRPAARLEAVRLLTAFCMVLALLMTGPRSLIASDVPFGQGLLWQVERDGKAPSFLFGTIHLGGKRILNLPRAVRQAFNAAEVACFELLVTKQAVQRIKRRKEYASPRRLDEVLGAALYADVARAAAPYGLSSDELRRLRPWAVLMVLRRAIAAQSTAPFEVALDIWLQREAEKQGKAVCALETLEEQLAALSDLPDEIHRALLRGLVDAVDRGALPRAADLDATVELYLAGEIGQLLERSRTAGSDVEQQIVDLLIDRLLTRRNYVMLERMAPRLAQGRAFVAVGAAHLPGQEGLLNLLAQRGYRITRLH